jgi:methionyl-tRNA formyltransferase
MRIIFAGTPEFAATALKALMASEHEIVAVYTQPDRPAGRGRKLRPSPVKVLAEKGGIPVYQPVSLKNAEVVEELKSHQADIMVVVAYGLILPANVLDAPTLGCVNIHASLLPRWRGAAPIQRAILAGDTLTGITIIQMETGLDTGPMLHRLACEIAKEETGSSLHDKLAALGEQAILEALTAMQNQEINAQKQDDAQACYAAKLQKEEAWLDWQDCAINLDRKIRAFNAWPVARSYWAGQMVMVWQADVVDGASHHAQAGCVLNVNDQGIDVASGEGVLRLRVLQFPGGKPLAVKDIIKSKTISPGDCFSSSGEMLSS